MRRCERRRRRYPYTVAVPGLPFKYVFAKVQLYKDGQKGQDPDQLKQYYTDHPTLAASDGRSKGGIKGFLQGTGIAGPC